MPEERSLAETSIEEPAGSAALGVVDSTVPTTPADFDMAAFVAGVRPPRRSVQLFPHAHLIAQLEMLAAQIEAADPDADVDHLIDQFEQTKAQFNDGVWFTVEQRSREWCKKFRLDAEKELGYSRHKNNAGEEILTTEQITTISFHQAAAQIVAPAGATGQHLLQLAQTSEGEVAKLMTVMVDVNSQLAQAATVLTRDFSLRRSAKTPTEDS